jgi:antitoxin ParD1/3/4
MAITLSPELQKYVDEKVRSGQFASAEEVVAQALRVFRNVEEALPGSDDDLCRELDLGLADEEAGRVHEWDVEELKRYIRAQAAGKKAS